MCKPESPVCAWTHPKIYWHPGGCLRLREEGWKPASGLWVTATLVAAMGPLVLIKTCKESALLWFSMVHYCSKGVCALGKPSMNWIIILFIHTYLHTYPTYLAGFPQPLCLIWGKAKWNSKPLAGLDTRLPDCQTRGHASLPRPPFVWIVFSLSLFVYLFHIIYTLIDC